MSRHHNIQKTKSVCSTLTLWWFTLLLRKTPTCLTPSSPIFLYQLSWLYFSMVSIYPKFILYTFCLLSYPSLGKGERRENLRQVRKIHRRMWKELDNSWGDRELILWVLPKKNLLHPLVLERMLGRVRVWGRGEDLGLGCYLMGLSFEEFLPGQVSREVTGFCVSSLSQCGLEIATVLVTSLSFWAAIFWLIC